jgi:hypothetical protein
MHARTVRLTDTASAANMLFMHRQQSGGWRKTGIHVRDIEMGTLPRKRMIDGSVRFVLARAS